MPLPSVKFDKSGSPLVVEITDSYIVAASFRISTWKGGVETEQMKGVNDVASHSCSLSPVASYDGQTVAWDIVIGKMAGGDGQYQAVVSIRQSDKTLYSHAFHDSFGNENKVEIYGGVQLAGT